MMVHEHLLGVLARTISELRAQGPAAFAGADVGRRGCCAAAAFDARMQLLDWVSAKH
jgi:hypothetical protein